MTKVGLDWQPVHRARTKTLLLGWCTPPPPGGCNTLLSCPLARCPNEPLCIFNVGGLLCSIVLVAVKGAVLLLARYWSLMGLFHHYADSIHNGDVHYMLCFHGMEKINAIVLTVHTCWTAATFSSSLKCLQPEPGSKLSGVTWFWRCQNKQQSTASGQGIRKPVSRTQWGNSRETWFHFSSPCSISKKPN